MYSKYQTPVDFSKQLIKGKVAEMIFEQMFRREEKFTVIPFGYESIIPELVQYAEKANRYELIEHIRNALILRWYHITLSKCF